MKISITIKNPFLCQVQCFHLPLKRVLMKILNVPWPIRWVWLQEVYCNCIDYQQYKSARICFIGIHSESSLKWTCLLHFLLRRHVLDWDNFHMKIWSFANVLPNFLVIFMSSIIGNTCSILNYLKQEECQMLFSHLIYWNLWLICFPILISKNFNPY